MQRDKLASTWPGHLFDGKFIIKVTFENLSESINLSRTLTASKKKKHQKKHTNSFTYTRTPNSAFIRVYLIHMIADLGHMFGLGANWEEREGRCVALFKGGGDRRGIIGQGFCGLAS